ncbi:MAG: sigma-54 dependent transcriptional regulator [candidate division KSB1 bacterium]|nr:sigma-54 dependent transcriptional regulator [candidate division KSB1 bacterium]
MEREKRVLFVDEDVNLVALVEASLARKGMAIFAVRTLDEARETLARGERYDFVLLSMKTPPVEEIRLLRKIRAEQPECAVVVMVGYGAINEAIVALKNGAVDYLLKPARPSQVLFALERTAERVARRGLSDALLLGHCRECRFSGVVAVSRRMRNVCHQVGTVANSNAPILLTGEPGTGKEIFSRTIHCLSPRRLNPYLKLSCGTLSAAELEAQLFGSGDELTDLRRPAVQGSPLITGGTVYLDEVAAMPVAIQARLVQALQEREIQGPDGVTTYGLDVRLVSSTRENLAELVDQGKFREDLYYKLNVVSITIPPLRRHPDDIMPLAEYFLDYYCDATGKRIRGFSAAVEEILTHYDWPGNVRELRNAVERAVMRSRGDKVEVGDLPEEVLPPADPKVVHLRLEDRRLEAAEEALIEQVLTETKGNISKTADILGVSRGTLYNKMEKYKLRK